MGLFVEIAIPTIMSLYCESVKTLRETKYKGRAFWATNEIAAVGNQYSWSVDNLLRAFPEKILYIHPTKLSK